MLTWDNWIVIGICFAVFAVQLILCFKVRRLWVRLIPLALFLSGAFFFLVLTRFLTDWSALGSLIIAVFLGFLFSLCLLGWGIFGIAKGISTVRRKRRGRD